MFVIQCRKKERAWHQLTTARSREEAELKATRWRANCEVLGDWDIEIRDDGEQVRMGRGNDQ